MKLHVNIDHVATLRNARGGHAPDPIEAAYACERAGADGITVHLREDRRHIRDRDVERLRESVATRLNLEMAPTAEMRAIALRLRPDIVTLVPERREERTTEGGLDVVGQRDALRALVAELTGAGIVPSLFVGPEAAVIEASREVGAAQVELHTGEWAHAADDAARAREIARLAEAAKLAARLGLAVAAGHGLTRHNVIDVAAIPEVVEPNIGHALVGDAVFMGLAGAVAAMREAIARGTARRGARG